jgi:hypothetical protein
VQRALASRSGAITARSRLSRVRYCLGEGMPTMPPMPPARSATPDRWESYRVRMVTLTRHYGELRRNGMARIFVGRAGIRNLEDWRPLVRWYWRGSGTAYCTACGTYLSTPEAIAMEILRHESGGHIHPGCGAWGDIPETVRQWHINVYDPANATRQNYRLYRACGVHPWGGYLR